VQLGDCISVSDLALNLSIKIVLVIKELLKLGVVAQPNTILDRDTATLVVDALGHTAVTLVEQNPESKLNIVYSGPSEIRNPVVTIMGHVDHGKTSLLDYIRRSRVAASESGGITQHIGAYRVDTQNGSVTFLDTPGHAAFTEMRARGTKCTDIAVILVAADDGVMPQTKEAVRHAKEAGVPIVVAINKIDKAGIDLERIKTEMSMLDVLPEEWGGDAPFMGVSAKTGEGMKEFLEILALQAEILELKACVQGPAQGMIIESSLSRHRGAVATVLIQQGTLSVGDMIVCGTSSGRVKALLDDLGQAVLSAGPSTPVQVIGLSNVVEAGDLLTAVSSEKQAREVIDYRVAQQKRQVASILPVNLEDFFGNDAKKKELNVVLKADTQGSVQAISEALRQLTTEEVNLKIVSQGVGGITESDIMLAKASSAVVLAFNTRAEKSAKVTADKEKIAIYYFSIIY
jgi:translation initiation factor IF-2